MPDNHYSAKSKGKDSTMNAVWETTTTLLELEELPIRLRTRAARRAIEDLSRDIASGKIPFVVSDGGKAWLSLDGEVRPLMEIAELVSSKDALANKDLSGASLSCVNFTDLDMRGAILEKANCVLSLFSKVSALDAKLFGAKCTWSMWSQSFLRRSTLKFADFSGTEITEVDFSDCDLANANFRGAKLEKANFQGANLAGSDFSGAEFRDSQFRESQFDESNFSFATFQDCHFPPVDLVSGNFHGVRWNGTISEHLPGHPPRKGDERELADLREIRSVRDRLHWLRRHDWLFRFAIGTKLGALLLGKHGHAVKASF
jgi:uncharacterized protein YjbI with pentapeptide repeats